MKDLQMLAEVHTTQTGSKGCSLHLGPRRDVVWCCIDVDFAPESDTALMIF